VKGFRPVVKGAIEPVRKTENAAGYDFYANETVIIKPLTKEKVGTGVATVGMLPHEVLILKLRSGTANNRPLVLEGGVIDSDFELTGEQISLILLNHHPSMSITVDKGERVAQGILLEYKTTDSEKKPTQKRKGGIGSTGTN
jgi:dUTP pyrophosphatase